MRRFVSFACSVAVLGCAVVASAQEQKAPVQAPVQKEAPVQAPVQKAVQAPVQAPVQKAVQAPVQKPVQKQVQAPVQKHVQADCCQSPVQKGAKTARHGGLLRHR